MLFDRGFISFSDDGTLIVSPVLPRHVLERLRIDPASIPPRALTAGQRKYMEYHRERNAHSGLRPATVFDDYGDHLRLWPRRCASFSRRANTGTDTFPRRTRETSTGGSREGSRTCRREGQSRRCAAVSRHLASRQSCPMVISPCPSLLALAVDWIAVAVKRVFRSRRNRSGSTPFSPGSTYR